MKKYRIFLLAAMILLLLQAGAIASRCEYYDVHGYHDLEQLGFYPRTCTEDGYVLSECQECALRVKEVRETAAGHTWKETRRINASCVEEGYIRRECSVCGEEWIQTSPMTEHEYQDHSVTRQPSCTQEGVMKTYCGYCGKEGKRTLEKTGHSYGAWFVSVAATDYSMGVRASVCANCGAQKTEKFYPDGTLMRGTKDSDGVKELQLMLVELGYLNDSVDGIFGKNTESAVKAFQREYGFDADGIAWPQTIRFIDAAWQQLKYPSASPVQGTAGYENLYESHDDGNYMPFCYSWENTDGTTVCEYCRKHAEMFAAAVDLLSNGDAESALYSYGMWQQEIIALYDTWLMQLPENEKSGVTACRSICISFMETQRAAMVDSYLALDTGIDPIDIEYGMELWMRAHVSWLCQMLSTLTGD